MIGLDGTRRRAMSRRGAARRDATRRTDDDNDDVIVDEGETDLGALRVFATLFRNERNVSSMIERDRRPLLILIESEPNSTGANDGNVNVLLVLPLGHSCLITEG